MSGLVTNSASRSRERSTRAQMWHQASLAIEYRDSRHPSRLSKNDFGKNLVIPVRKCTMRQHHSKNIRLRKQDRRDRKPLWRLIGPVCLLSAVLTPASGSAQQAEVAETVPADTCIIEVTTAPDAK